MVCQRSGRPTAARLDRVMAVCYLEPAPGVLRNLPQNAAPRCGGQVPALRLGNDKTETVSIISKAIEVDPALFDKMGMPYMDPDGKFDVPSMKIDLAYFKEMGYYDGKAEIEPTIDTQFIEYAAKQLGPHT